MTTLILEGLDASNPLGFLAALGTLRVASLGQPFDVRMGWVQTTNGLRPKIILSSWNTDKRGFVEALHCELLKMQNHPALSFAADLNVVGETFATLMKQAAETATPVDRVFADFLAAFGTEVVTSASGVIEDTAFRTMQGAGHQHFLGSMRELVENTTPKHLFEALFMTWTYSDGRPSMRWDPTDDRRYALRWGDPSDTSRNPIRTSRGANRLAIEALPLFPVMPWNRRATTTGFSKRNGRVEWSWPIWEKPVPLDVVRSLLSYHELQKERPNRERLRTIGVIAVFRCERISVGKYRNFTLAHPV